MRTAIQKRARQMNRRRSVAVVVVVVEDVVVVVAMKPAKRAILKKHQGPVRAVILMMT